MTRIEYNGGSDVFVGLSTEPVPTVAKDHIAEGALLILRDTREAKIFSGDDTEGWNDFCSFS